MFVQVANAVTIVIGRVKRKIVTIIALFVVVECCLVISSATIVRTDDDMLLSRVESSFLRFMLLGSF